MDANLFGERYYGFREPGWHKLGRVFLEEKDLITAFEEGGLNYDISLENFVVKFQGEEMPVNNMFAVIRHKIEDYFIDTPPSVLGIVSTKYNLIQNKEIAETFNELSQRWHVETVGALGQGEQIFATLDAGEIEIKGDLIHQYFMITDNKIGKEATKICFTPVRVVCQNTLISGLSQAELTVNVWHRADNISQLQRINNLALELQKRADIVNSLFVGMTEQKFNLQQFKELLELVVYPTPKKQEKLIETNINYEYLTDRAFENRSSAEFLFNKFNDEFPQFGETKWSAWNSIVELEDYRKGKNEGSLVSALFGQRARTKELAFAELNK